MQCPECKHTETRVVDTRLNQTSDVVRRRRHCESCGFRFTTYEHVEEILPEIVKKDGRREEFSREKILSSFKKALQKRNVATDEIEHQVTLIEREIRALGLKEITSRHIGNLVMESLRKIDKVGYIRFASVYRDFRDVEGFVAELKEDLKRDLENAL